MNKINGLFVLFSSAKGISPSNSKDFPCNKNKVIALKVMFSSRVKWTKTMWTSSESYQPYDSNNIASKTITRCDAIEEESDSDKSPLILPSKEKVS